MNFLGRIIGAIIGFRFGSYFGAMFGFWLGLLFDRKFQLGTSKVPQEKKQELFFATTFKIMGHVAKADGIVSQIEIKQAEAVMGRMNLSAAQMKLAREYFRQGKEPDFDADQALQEFSWAVGKRSSLAMMFIEIQISSALADGVMRPQERAILLKACGYMGIPQIMFDQLVNMIIAGQNFKNASGAGAGYRPSGNTYQSSRSKLDEAYAILGVKKTDSDAAVKRAYRKLLSQHHPDKLQSKGLPDEMIKMATEKTHEIRQAYELIKQQRVF